MNQCQFLISAFTVQFDKDVNNLCTLWLDLVQDQLLDTFGFIADILFMETLEHLFKVSLCCLLQFVLHKLVHQLPLLGLVDLLHFLLKVGVDVLRGLGHSLPEVGEDQQTVGELVADLGQDYVKDG